MPISSVGYAGTVEDVQWARMAPSLGSIYGVETPDAWRVSSAPGTRRVQIAVGAGWGWGVQDVSNAIETLESAPAVPSGDRWDLVVARRDWAAETTTFAWRQGGSAAAIPAGRLQGPGGVDEQPIALVRFRAGLSVPQQIIDLRVYVGLGGAVANHPLVRQYLTQVGTKLRIGDTEWTRDVDSLGESVWRSLPVGDTGEVRSGVAFTNVSGRFQVPSYMLRSRAGHTFGWVGLTYRTNQPAVTLPASGEIGPWGVLQLPAPFRPAYSEVPLVMKRGRYHLFPEIAEDGTISLLQGLPGVRFDPGTNWKIFIDYPSAGV